MSTLDDELSAWLSPSNPAYARSYNHDIEVAQTLLELRDIVAIRAACQKLTKKQQQRVLQELIAEQRALVTKKMPYALGIGVTFATWFKNLASKSPIILRINCWYSSLCVLSGSS